MANSCDTCAYNVYDEEYGEYVCDIDMDEDEYMRFLSDRHTQCPTTATVTSIWWCAGRCRTQGNSSGA